MAMDDIAQRKQAAKEFRASEEMFRAAFEQAILGMAILLPDGRFVQVNSRLCQILGYSAEELLQRSLADTTHPEDLQASADLHRSILAGERPYSLDERYLRKDGSVVWGQVTLAVVERPSDGTKYLLATVLDITQSKREEEARQAAEERFNQFVENSDDVFWMTNRTATDVLFVGRAYERVWGRSCESLYERPMSFLDSIHPEDRQNVMALVKKQSEGMRTSEEYRVLRPDGSVRWVHDRGFPIANETGQIYRVAGIATDVTERKRAEAEQTRLWSILEASLNEIYIFDAHTLRFQYANQCARANLGYSMDSLRLLTPIELKPEFDLETFGELIEPLRRHAKEKLVFETLHRRADGTRYPVEVHLQLVECGGDAVFLAVINDITERKRAEAALNESRERLLTAQRVARLGFLDWNLQTNEIYLSDEIYRLYGLEPGQKLVGPDFVASTVHPDDLGRVQENLELAVRGVKPYDITHRAVRPDGSVVWFHAQGEILRDEEGAPKTLLCTIVDVTELMHAEEVLRESEANLQTLFEQVAVGVAQIDTATGRFARINRRYCEILGYTQEEMLRLTFQEVMHPEDLQADLDNMARLHRGEISAFSMEKRYLRKDGATVWVNLSVSAPSSFGGTSDFHTAVVEDITERKRRDRDIQRARDRLQTLSRRLLEIQETERRQLARELHDEIGQTLTAIKINLQSLRRDPEPATFDTRLDESRRIVDRALGQVRSMSLALRPPLLDDLGVAAATRWLTGQCIAQGLGVEFRCGIADERFDVSVETACFRVAQEALTNITRHARAQSVVVELALKDGTLHLDVRDDGAGFNVEAAHIRAVRGASLGILSMVERASLAGGGIEWRSTLGQGTEVHAWFPVPRPARSGGAEVPGSGGA